MPARWRVLDCSSLKGELRAARGQVLVLKDGDTFRVPVFDLAVCLVGPGTVFSAGTMHRLLEADVPVVFCDWRGVPEGGASPWSDNTRVGARNLAQVQLSVPRIKNAWGQVVKAKVAGQAQTLVALNLTGAGQLRGLAKAVRSGDPQNIEAQAARFYWKFLFGEAFIRDPGSGGGVNGMLDYAYTVVRGAGIRSVCAAGLWPALGIHHHGRGNPFSLVDDLIEPFRPVADWIVATLPADADMDESSTRAALVAVLTTPFDDTGRTVATAFDVLAHDYARYVEGKITKLCVPTWGGPVAGECDGG